MARSADGNPPGVARGLARVPGQNGAAKRELSKAEAKAAKQLAKNRELIHTPGWIWEEEHQVYTHTTPLHVAEVRHLANPYVRGFDETSGPSHLLVFETPDAEGTTIWARPDEGSAEHRTVSEDLRWKMNSVSRILNGEIKERANAHKFNASPVPSRPHGADIVPVQVKRETSPQNFGLKA